MWKIFCMLSLLLLNIIPATIGQRRDCSRSEYERCVAIADPLVKEAHLIFPDNLDDIDLVCRTWNHFVDCLKAYTEDCFTEAQRRQFNRAVESPIESVHEMCMQPNYQKEYLRYASCIKSTIIERDHCGPHYNLLVGQVEQGDVISKSTLCCSHDRFKACVQKETRRLCDQGIPDGPAFRFATQTIDKALRFLQDQCVNTILNAGDCIPLLDAVSSYSDSFLDHKNVVSASSEVYPWSTIQQSDNKEFYHDNRQNNNENQREIQGSRVSKFSTTTWLPSPPARAGNPTLGSNPTREFGSRSRPSSYGRASSWPTESSSTTVRSAQNYPQNVAQNPVEQSYGISSTLQSNGLNSLPSEHGQKAVTNTVPSVSESALSSTPFTNKWGTIEVVPKSESNGKTATTSPSTSPIDKSTGTPPFSTPSWYPTSSTETWYPAAGFQLNNEVDEPNQMGLIKPKNGAISLRSSSAIILICVVVGYVWLELRNT